MAGGSRKGFIPALFGTLYGDQSIFVSPLSFQTPGGFGKIPLMENVEFSKRLRRSGNVALLDPPRQTCPRKHQMDGAWKLTLRNLLFLISGRFVATLDSPTRPETEA